MATRLHSAALVGKGGLLLPGQDMNHQLRVLLVESDQPEMAAVKDVLDGLGLKTMPVISLREVPMVANDWPPDVLLLHRGELGASPYRALARLHSAVDRDSLHVIAIDSAERITGPSDDLPTGWSYEFLSLRRLPSSLATVSWRLGRSLPTERISDVCERLLGHLMEMSRTPRSNTDWPALGTQALESALAATGLDAGTIYLRDDGAAELKPLAWVPARTELRPPSIPLSQAAPIVEVAAGGPEAFLAHAWGARVRQGDPFCRAYLPLRSGDRTLGAAELRADEPRRLPGWRLDFAQLTLNQLANTIELGRALAAADLERRKSRALIEACPEGILIVDGNQRVVAANEALERIAGVSIDSLIGRQCRYRLGATVNEHTPVCDASCPFAHPGAPGIARQQVATVLHTPDGQAVATGITYICLRDETGSPEWVIHALRRLSAPPEDAPTEGEPDRRGETERRLLQSILDQIPDGVSIASSPEGKLLMANRKAREMLGENSPLLGESEVAAETSRVFAPDGHPLLTDDLPFRRAIAGEIRTGVQVEVPRGDGEMRALLVNASPLIGTGGSILGVVSTFHDITPIRDLEHMKDNFLAMASHELRTPITSIKGYAQMLTRRLGRAEGHQQELKALHIIIRQIDRLVLLVNQMLDVSRMQRGQLQLVLRRVDLAGLVGEVRERLQAVTDRHSLVMEPHPPLHVMADESRVEQVLTNLLTNAIKYSPEGGEVVIRLSADQRRAVVAVQDYGVGIPASRVARVFERYYQAHADAHLQYGGLGLGLFLSREIIARHGGTMWVESTEGHGSTFYFSLPTAPAAHP